jgi:hypothetical protein
MLQTDRNDKQLYWLCVTDRQTDMKKKCVGVFLAKILGNEGASDEMKI